jgi:RNA polymerase sigma-54 factor
MALSQRLEIRQGQALVMTPQLLQAIKLLQLSHVELASYVDQELERNPLLERAEDQPPLPDVEAPAAEPGLNGTAGEWFEQGLETSREAIERNLDTSLDNVFDEDAAARAVAAPQADALPVSSSLWSGVSGGSFDDEVADFAASLTRDVSLHEHLLAQLDLATADPLERLIGRYIVDAIDEAGYLSESPATIADRLSAAPALVEAVLAKVQRFEPTGIGARDLAECLAIQLKERDRFDPAMAALV